MLNQVQHSFNGAWHAAEVIAVIAGDAIAEKYHVRHASRYIAQHVPKSDLRLATDMSGNGGGF